MSSELKSAAASLLCVGFEHDPGRDPNGAPFPEATAELLRMGVSGVILFQRNIRSPGQLVRLNAALKRAASNRLLLAVDQEGGRVARLRHLPFNDLPPARTLGETGNERRAFTRGMTLASDLSLVGFDVNFAPVLDVDTNPLNPVIGDRALSADPHVVARLGVALAKGLEAGGVASCAKHFPGHGDTAQDSHLELPRLNHSMKRLREVELVPFRAYARARLSAVMSAHVAFDAIDPGLPATFSAKIQTGLLRAELGFEGLNVCDDLEMNAIAAHFPIEEAAVRAVRAGIDWLLVCHHPEAQLRCVEALIHEAERSSDFRRRLRQAYARVQRFVVTWFREVTVREIAAVDRLMRDLSLTDETPPASIDDPTDYLDKLRAKTGA